MRSQWHFDASKSPNCAAGQGLDTADPQQRGAEGIGYHPVAGKTNRIQGC